MEGEVGIAQRGDMGYRDLHHCDRRDVEGFLHAHRGRERRDFRPFLLIIFILLIYLLGGSFIDDLAFLILATPIFFPVVVKLGYDAIWFGVILHIFAMIGIVIPPGAVK